MLCIGGGISLGLESANRLVPAQQIHYSSLALLRSSPGVDLKDIGAGQKLPEELVSKMPLEAVFYQQMGVIIVVFLQ